MNDKDWLLSVLDDLATWSAQQDLPRLTDQIIRAKATAQWEFNQKTGVTESAVPQTDPYQGQNIAVFGVDCYTDSDT